MRISPRYLPDTVSGYWYLAKVNKNQWGLLFLTYTYNDLLSGATSHPSIVGLHGLGALQN